MVSSPSYDANLLAAQLVVRKMRSEPLPEECVVA